MGAGASFDPSAGDGMTHYFCHNCSRNFLRHAGENLTCPNCNSSFVEEVEQPFRRRGQYHLSEEQARRLSSAAALLQLLENQLREELNLLQANYDESDKKSRLTKLMRESLRAVYVDVDKIVAQPGCPICSEDYTIGDSATQLPCGHIYHEACVMPWLESKLTCPICRHEMVNVVPPLNELQELSQEELLKRIADRQEVDATLHKMNRMELGSFLHRLMQAEMREHEAEQQRNEQPGSPVFPSPSPNSAAAAAAASIMFSNRGREENPLRIMLTRHSQQTHDELMQQVQEADEEHDETPLNITQPHRTAVRRYRARNTLRRQLEDQQNEAQHRSYSLNWIDVDSTTQDDSEETAVSSSSNDTTSLSQDHNSLVNAAYHREPTQLLLRPSGMSASPQRTYVLQSIQNGSGVRLMQTSHVQSNRSSNLDHDSNMLSSTSYRPRSLRQLMEEN